MVSLQSLAYSQSPNDVFFSQIEDGNALPANYFLGYAEGYAASRGYRLSNVSRGDIFQRLLKHADVIRKDPKAQDHTKTALARLIEAMIAASDVRRGDPRVPGTLGRLGEDTLSAAVTSLCPLWPIC